MLRQLSVVLNRMNEQKQFLLAHRLALAGANMSDAERYCNGIVDLGHVPKPIWESTILAIMVVYCRSFINSESEGEALSKVPIGRLRMFEGEPELRKLYDKLLALRMKAIAHSDWEHHQTGFDYENIDLTIGRMARTSVRPSFTCQMESHLFVKLLSHVRYVCGTARLEIDRAHHRCIPQRNQNRPRGVHGYARRERE